MPPRMDPNLKTRVDVYDFICAYKKTHNGHSPSIRKIRDGAGLHSTSHTQMLLNSLVRMGKIEIVSDGARMISVVGSEWIPPVQEPQG